MKKIVLASGNRGKLAEFGQLLGPHQVEVLPQSQFVAEGAEETGTTFLENALLKARHASRAANLPAIADDSGIEVDALSGAPGVYSARYAGESADDEANNRKLLAALANKQAVERTARYRCVLVYVRHADDPQPIIAEGSWEGFVLTAPRGSGGFGYDPLFMPSGQTRSAAELSSAEKNSISHRGIALRELVRVLINHGEITA